MIYTSMTKKAMSIMFEAHKNQVDKAGIPYVFHPWHVAEEMTSEISTTVALLHDVVEDAGISFCDLVKIFPDDVIKALSLLTHTNSLDYFSYIKRIAENPIATEVKIADLKHNLDTSRLNKITLKDIKRNIKYQRCLKYLEEKGKNRAGKIYVNKCVQINE